jgi:hypothetical protein
MRSSQSYIYQHLDSGEEDVNSFKSDPLHSTAHAAKETSQICGIRIFSLPGGFLLLNLILFIFSLLILMGSVIHAQHLSNNIDNSLLKETSSYCTYVFLLLNNVTCILKLHS